MRRDIAAAITDAATMDATKEVIKVPDDRAFHEMLQVARARLDKRDPEKIAEHSGAVYDPETSTLQLTTLNKDITLTFPQLACSGKLDEWHHLLLLHYLDLADGTPVSDRLISFGMLKDGVIRGTKFDRTVEQELEKFLRDKTPEEVERICRALGAEKIHSKADLSMVFPFFPNYPVTVNIWFADEEFPPSGKMLLSESADHYLTVEDAVTVGDVLLKLLASV